jgi:hypothetical protein
MNPLTQRSGASRRRRTGGGIGQSARHGRQARRVMSARWWLRCGAVVLGRVPTAGTLAVECSAAAQADTAGS